MKTIGLILAAAAMSFAQTSTAPSTPAPAKDNKATAAVAKKSQKRVKKAPVANNAKPAVANTK